MPGEVDPRFVGPDDPEWVRQVHDPIGLARWIVWDLGGDPDKDEDAVQEALVGYTEARRRYDPQHRKGASFRTMACVQMRGWVLHLYRSRRSSDRIQAATWVFGAGPDERLDNARMSWVSDADKLIHQASGTESRCGSCGGERPLDSKAHPHMCSACTRRYLRVRKAFPTSPGVCPTCATVLFLGFKGVQNGADYVKQWTWCRRCAGKPTPHMRRMDEQRQGAA